MNLKEIAKLAGVSTVTVSNVINGKYNRASKDTIERVQKIVEENHYQPSATARSLITKKSRIIGVVIPWVDEGESFAKNPYNAQMLGYLSSYIRSRDYYLMLSCVEWTSQILPDVATWNVDGTFVLSTFAQDALQLSEKLHIPAVFIDTYPTDASLATVGIEDRQGGYLAARYLLDKGHRDIAFVGTPIRLPGVEQERYFGFCDAFADRGVDPGPDHRFEIANSRYSLGVEVGREIGAAARRFTAVAVMSDVVAFGVMEGLRQSGLRVPEDISVVGFDDLPECEYSHPRLTSVSQHLEEKARVAGDCLFSMLECGKTLPGARKVSVELAERDSVVPRTAETPER